MSDRSGLRPLPTNHDEALAVLYEICQQQAAEIKSLQERTGALPGGFRFIAVPGGGLTIRRLADGAVTTIILPVM